MKTGNTFWKIIFLLLPFSNSGLSPGPKNPDSLRVPSPIPCAVPIYQPKPQREVGLKYFSTVILAKNFYHYEAVSSLMREGKRYMTNRFPEPEIGTTKELFPGLMSTLILTEAISTFIFHQLKVMDLKNEWFHEYQF